MNLKILVLVLVVFTAGVATAQSPADGIVVAATGIDDRGPWGGTSRVYGATRAAEWMQAWTGLNGSFLTGVLAFENSAGKPWVPADSTATHIITPQRWDLGFNLEPVAGNRSTSFLANLYRTAARLEYQEGRTMRNGSAFSLRNAYQDIVAIAPDNATKTIRLNWISRILLKPGTLD